MTLHCDPLRSTKTIYPVTETGDLIQMVSNVSCSTSRLHLLNTMSTLPKKRAIKQFCSPAVFNTMSDGHTVYSSCTHLDNISDVIIVKNCLPLATARYANYSPIITNWPVPLWKKCREWIWYSTSSTVHIGTAIQHIVSM